MGIEPFQSETAKNQYEATQKQMLQMMREINQHVSVLVNAVDVSLPDDNKVGGVLKKLRLMVDCLGNTLDLITHGQTKVNTLLGFELVVYPFAATAVQGYYEVGRLETVNGKYVAHAEVQLTPKSQDCYMDCRNGSYNLMNTCDSSFHSWVDTVFDLGHLRYNDVQLLVFYKKKQ